MSNKTVTRILSGGTMTTTSELAGVRTTTAVPALKETVLAVDLVKSSYRTHKVWNPATQAYISVNMTGNEAQDAQMMAAAFATAGERSNSVISST